MPHVIYLHSALTQRRVVGKTDEEKKRIFRFETIDVMIAMGIAGVINLSMLSIAAVLLGSRGLTNVADIDVAFEQFRVLEGSGFAILFGVALLSSGLSSSSVGTMAGQVVMQGFINRRIPLFLRRAITMLPALTILTWGSCGLACSSAPPPIEQVRQADGKGEQGQAGGQRQRPQASGRKQRGTGGGADGKANAGRPGAGRAAPGLGRLVAPEQNLADIHDEAHTHLVRLVRCRPTPATSTASSATSGPTWSSSFAGPTTSATTSWPRAPAPTSATATLPVTIHRSESWKTGARLPDAHEMACQR